MLRCKLLQGCCPSDVSFLCAENFLQEHRQALEAQLQRDLQEITDSRARTRDELEGWFDHMLIVSKYVRMEELSFKRTLRPVSGRVDLHDMTKRLGLELCDLPHHTIHCIQSFDSYLTPMGFPLRSQESWLGRGHLTFGKIAERARVLVREYGGRRQLA